MLGKLAVLHGVPMDGFQVDYGIKYNRLGCFDFQFAKFHFETMGNYERKTYIRGGHHIENDRDGFKKIILNGSDEEVLSDCKDEVEEYLMVVVPKALQIVSNAEKIAGRYPDEGIFTLREGDTIEVSKSIAGPRDIYMAIKARNEMFLVKKSR